MHTQGKPEPALEAVNRLQADFGECLLLEAEPPLLPEACL